MSHRAAVHYAEQAALAQGVHRTLFNSLDRLSNIRLTHQLINADTVGTLACLMLNALQDTNETSMPGEVTDAEYEAQHNLFVELLAQKLMTPDETGFSYVEPGSLEHNTVLIVLQDGFSAQKLRWLQVETNGRVTRTVDHWL